MPTDMKFLSLVSNDLLTKQSEAKERSRAKLLAVNMTIVNQGKAVSCQQKISILFLFFRSHIIWPSCILQDPGLFWPQEMPFGVKTRTSTNMTQFFVPRVSGKTNLCHCIIQEVKLLV
ncbi:uncharacterized protein [Solanum tuberosum]|uniref:uncharacterized protein isoform X7 n=1 Tax=Solanum tuberosum TaxID=4113 RepID=UPI000739FF19|nr:PREDICTED: uncharacterized protein LOC102579395 isoform X7 [Solanum tuberosum]